MARLARLSSASPSLIVAPAHLREQWRQELAAQGASAEVVTYEEAGALRAAGWRRLVIDEPQDSPAQAWQGLQRLADDFREAGGCLKHGDPVSLWCLWVIER